MSAVLKPTHPPITQRSFERRSILRPVPSNPEKIHLHLAETEGQLQVHTAPYRGSFSVVLSEALRAAGLGSRVMVVQFLKGGVDQGPEGTVHLCGRLEWLRPAVSCCLTEPASEKSLAKNNPNAIQAVKDIWEVCKNRLLAGELDQVVLDEIGLAISLGYLKEEDLISTLEKRPKAMDVILTGPAIPPPVMSMADQVTELRCGH